MAIRILLWTIVLLVPGGVLALPLLVAQHTRRRPPAPSQPASKQLLERLSQA